MLQAEFIQRKYKKKIQFFFQVRHPRCLEYKLKYNIYIYIYIYKMQSDTTYYFIKLY